MHFDTTFEGQIRGKLKVGVKLRTTDNLYHIRSIVDDDKVVWRFWNYRKARWIYDVVDII